jgi:hypothetical protein
MSAARLASEAFGDDGSARAGRCGNDNLRNLLAEDKAYPAAFRFSTLQILPKSMARDLVLQGEHRYRPKLGSKATGLNT